MIGDSTQLLAWIESTLPALDEDHFGPWQAQPGRPGAISARVDVRIRSRGVRDRHTVIVFVGRPTHRRPFRTDTAAGIRFSAL